MYLPGLVNKYLLFYHQENFIVLGDAAYPKVIENAISSFDFTKNDKGYRMIYNNNFTSIVGVWDDHDYGKNDGNLFISLKYIIDLIKGDKNDKHKHKMRQLYLDFLDEPSDSIRRT